MCMQYMWMVGVKKSSLLVSSLDVVETQRFISFIFVLRSIWFGFATKKFSSYYNDVKRRVHLKQMTFKTDFKSLQARCACQR